MPHPLRFESKKGRICVAWVWNREGTEKLVNGKQHSVWFVRTGMNGLPQNVLLNFRLVFPKSDVTIYLLSGISESFCQMESTPKVGDSFSLGKTRQDRTGQDRGHRGHRFHTVCPLCLCVPFRPQVPQGTQETQWMLISLHRAVEAASQGASIIILAARFWRRNVVLEWPMKLSPHTQAA